jgi:hypothetical protein
MDLGGLIKIMSKPTMGSTVAELHLQVFKMLVEHEH